MSAVPTAECKTLLKEQGWDQGVVFFGNPASENSVRMLTMLEYLKAKGKIPGYKLVTIDFNAAPFDATKAYMGKESPEWQTLTSGLTYMPGVAIDGTMYMEVPAPAPPTSLSLDRCRAPTHVVSTPSLLCRSGR